MIKVKNLIKRYGELEAVRDVSFEIKKGMIYGFLGPNGAGKSTTMNIITGCLAATSGEVEVNGCDIYEDPIGAKSSVGYLPELPPLYTDMTPEEYLEFVGEAKGLSGDKLYKEIDRVIEKTGLKENSGRLIKNLSKGYRQRVGIAQALIGDPEIIILDEPTVGLDPLQIIEIRELIRELGRDHTVILSSHILTEISAVCDYVIIIAKGKVVASDTLENLIKLYEGKNYIDIIAKCDAERAEKLIGSINGVLSCEVEAHEGAKIHVRIATESSVDIREEVFYRFADAKMPILTMAYEEVTLEKVFLELTAEKAEKPAVKPKREDDKPIAVREEDEDTEENEENEENSIQSDEPQISTKKDDGDDDYKPLFS